MEKPFQIDRKLNADHPYSNTLLDRIVIGQRLSQFLQSEDGEAIHQTMVADLVQQCLSADNSISDHFLIDGEFNQDRIFMSDLRVAPIIGLGTKVWLTQC